MKVNSEKIEKSQVRLEVEVEEPELAEAREKTYRQLANRVTVPGFRKGRAPRHLIERMIGPDALWSETLEQLLPMAYREALKQADIVPVDDPEVDVKSREPLVLEYVVPVRPEIELGDYRSIKVEPEAPRDIAQDVETTLLGIQERYADWAVVERPAQKDDRVKADVAAWFASPLLVDTSGNPLLRSEESKLLDDKDADILLDPERQRSMPDVVENIYGMTAGETREFTVKPKAESADNIEVAPDAKVPTFRVTLHEVREKKLPALDDDLAVKSKWMGKDYATLDELKTEIVEYWTKWAEQEAKQKLNDAIIDKLIAQASLELPPAMIRSEAARIQAELADDLKQRGVSVDQYVKMMGLSKEDLEAKASEQAERRLRRTLVLNKLAIEQNVEVTDEDITSEIEKMASSMPGEGDHLRETFADGEKRHDLAFAIKLDKAVDWLTKVATGEIECTAPVESETQPVTAEATEVDSEA